MADSRAEKLASEMANEIADQVERVLINPLNDYLMASSEADASHVLRNNPQLMASQATGLIDKFVSDALCSGDDKSAQRLVERRQLIDAHRRAGGGASTSGH